MMRSEISDYTDALAAYAFPRALRTLGEFAFIDVETTGTKALQDRVTEIAIIRFHADGAQERWQSLIYPGVPIPADRKSVV